MKRRDFINTCAATTAGFLLGPFGTSNAGNSSSWKRNLTILHTNDIHSRIEAFPNDGGRNANQGGLLNMAPLVQQIRKETENVLLFDSGDAWQGTPYFNLYKGELEFKLMSEMKFDASTLGNHEFDNGLEGILEQLPYAGFSHLCANYDFSETILKDAFAPYRIFQKQGLRIGVFGIGIALEGLVGRKNYGQTRYIDPIGVSKEMVQELRNKKCHAIVCLSHLGLTYKNSRIDDHKLAAGVAGIDLILGGHTHTFMDQPIQVQNPEDKPTLIHQSGTGALRLGRIDMEFSRGEKLTHIQASSLRI
jgi:5'-nucleotidase